MRPQGIWCRLNKLLPGPVWLRTLGALSLLSALAVGLGLLAGALAALTLLAAALLVMLLRDRTHLAKLWNWVAGGRHGPLPPAAGLWDDLFAQLYRQEKAGTQQHAALTDALLGFRKAAQALPDGVVTLDAGNHIIWCNHHASEHLGLRLPGDAGGNIANLLRMPDFLAYLGGTDWATPLILRSGYDGTNRERLLSLRLVAYGEEQKLLLSRDVTDIQRLETMRRDFVANVSHEMKTPLTVLSGFLETLREVPLTSEQTSRYLELMTEQARRMENLVTDLLTLSALEAPGGPIEETVNMQSLLEASVHTARQLSQGRHHILAEFEAGLDLLGAPSEVSSAVNNLVTNALRYTPQGGTISLRWESCALPDGAGARFSVSDTGIGIEATHLPRLTERFYRVDRGRSRDSGGTGLGLAIVKHVLNRHQATLAVESELGQGSRFAATFPPRRVLRA